MPATHTPDSHYAFAVGNARAFARDGTWLRDGDGRYVLLRGVNLASRSKLPPYLPVLPVGATSFDPDSVARELDRLQPELCRLETLGVNVVRLLVMWKAIEPEHHEAPAALLPAGRAYLDAVRQVVDTLYHRHRMLVVIDFHQDIASEAYGGDGFPDWAIAVDAQHPRPPAPPPPRKWWGIRYYDVAGSSLSDGVRRTLYSFWRNRLTNTEAGLVDDEVQAHLARTIGLTAGFFKDHPAVLGYEPFNEPHPVGIAKDEFEPEALSAFYARVRTEVAAQDPLSFLFVEPRMDWTTFPADEPEPSVFRPWRMLRFTDKPQTFLGLERFGRDARVIFSFHYYDPWLVTQVPFLGRISHRARAWPAVFAGMNRVIRGQGAVPFLSEFGCDQDWTDRPDLRPEAYGTVARACMDLQYREVEAKLLSATYWTWDFYSRRDAKGRASENWNEENASLLGPDGPQNVDVVARPYPMRSAAMPELVFFDLVSKQASIILAGAVVAAPTVVFVPRDFHYPRGFDLRATTARAPQWDAARRLIYWWPDPGERRNVLIITPGGAVVGEGMPAAAVELLPQTRGWSFREPATSGPEGPQGEASDGGSGARRPGSPPASPAPR